MLLNVVIQPDGSVSIRVPNGQSVSFQEAKAKTQEFCDKLNTSIPISLDGEIERHVHGPDGQHVRAQGSEHSHG